MFASSAKKPPTQSAPQVGLSPISENDAPPSVDFARCLTVWIGKGLGGRREVLDWNNSTIVNTENYAAQKYLPTHHSDHEWPDFKPGPDVVNVYPRSLSMLRTYPGEGGALTVSASPLRYIKGNALVIFPGKNSLDISASQPASGLALFVGIYLDPDDNTLKSVDGATTSDSPAITPDSPAFPESAILSANVRLNGDQTVFSEVDMVDVRQILDASGAIDGVRVSKLVSPDGLTDPVLSADNSGDVTLAGTGDIILPDDIIHSGDIDTLISLETDKIIIQAGGVEMAAFIEDTQDEVVINDAQADVDFRVEGDGQENLLFLKASNDRIGIHTNSPGAVLDIEPTGAARILDIGGTNTSHIINVTSTISATASPQILRFVPTIDPGAVLANIFGINTNITVAGTSSNAITNLTLYNAAMSFGSSYGGTITNLYNYFSSNPTDGSSGSPAITNNYGLFIEDLTLATNNWGIYVNGSTLDSFIGGNLGLGTDAPQGKFHTYETISGFIVWEFDGLDGTVRTIIPNGTGDVLYRLTALFVLRDSAAAVASGTTDVSNGASVNLTVGTNTVRLRVNADGSTDIARTAGTDTIKVALVLRWL